MQPDNNSSLIHGPTVTRADKDREAMGWRNPNNGNAIFQLVREERAEEEWTRFLIGSESELNPPFKVS
jgi:hypothetical protein